MFKRGPDVFSLIKRINNSSFHFLCIGESYIYTLKSYSMEKAFVELKNEKGIGKITFYHPQHNALPTTLLVRIVECLEQANKDNGIKVVLLQSAGDRTFCAGANFDELLSIKDLESGKDFFKGFGNLISTIRKLNKLVVARVQGKAVGGGVGRAAACDIAFSTKYSSIRLSEISIGIGPFVIGPALERKIGKAAFSKLSLIPTQWMDAKSAQHVGLFAEVFDDIDKMDEYLESYLKLLASYNPDALHSMKKILWKGCEEWDKLLDERAEMSGRLVLSDFTKKALKEFKK